MSQRSDEAMTDFTEKASMFGVSLFTCPENVQARLRSDAHSALDVYFDVIKADAEQLKAIYKKD